MCSSLSNLGGSPSTTCDNWSNILVHLGYGNFPEESSIYKTHYNKYYSRISPCKLPSLFTYDTLTDQQQYSDPNN